VLRLLATRDRFQTFAQVYAYFRWADDIVDAPGRDPREVCAFAAGQDELIAGRRPPATPEEQGLVEALKVPAVRPAVHSMWSALVFDAARGEEPLAPEALDAQIARVGDAWTLAAAWAAGEDAALPGGVFELARAATRVHTLRDVSVDLTLGYRNFPPSATTDAGMRAWRREMAARARAGFAAGREALPGVRRRRARILLWLMAWRYERVLTTVG
jgi:hypothetical protein